MRKKQTIKAIVHLPSPQAIEFIQKKMNDFYIQQVEKQIITYDITKEQQQQVLRELAQKYHSLK